MGKRWPAGRGTRYLSQWNTRMRQQSCCAGQGSAMPGEILRTVKRRQPPMNRAALAAALILAACSHDPSRNGSGGGEGGIVDAAPLRTDWTPDQLKTACQEAQKTCDAKLARIVGLRDTERTFANTPEAIEQVTTDWSEAVGLASL